MVYLSAAQLLWDVRVLLDAKRGRRKFVGTDSNFTLIFRHEASTVETLQDDVRIDKSAVVPFTTAVLASAKALFAVGMAEIEEDRVGLDDLGGAIEKYEAWQIARRP